MHEHILERIDKLKEKVTLTMKSTAKFIVQQGLIIRNLMEVIII